MPYSDDAHDYWKVRENDSIGGFIVVNCNKTMTEITVASMRQEGDYAICDTGNKADAEIIASLLNRAGVRRTNADR